MLELVGSEPESEIDIQIESETRSKKGLKISSLTVPGVRAALSLLPLAGTSHFSLARLASSHSGHMFSLLLPDRNF